MFWKILHLTLYNYKIILTKRIIITGGPGFGKTSVITSLEKRGFHCFHEFSRSLIKEQLITGGDILPWKNLEKFSEIVFNNRLSQYHNAPVNQLSFYDRGIPDVVAYLEKDNLDIQKHYLDAQKKHLYHPMVFITPPWEDIYINDAERKENYSDSLVAHYHIVKKYMNLGYQLIELPRKSIEERVEFIISKLS